MLAGIVRGTSTAAPDRHGQVSSTAAVTKRIGALLAEEASCNPGTRPGSAAQSNELSRKQFGAGANQTDPALRRERSTSSEAVSDESCGISTPRLKLAGASVQRDKAASSRTTSIPAGNADAHICISQFF